MKIDQILRIFSADLVAFHFCLVSSGSMLTSFQRGEEAQPCGSIPVFKDESATTRRMSDVSFRRVVFLTAEALVMDLQVVR
jgi:hypothetical protein